LKKNQNFENLFASGWCSFHQPVSFVVGEKNTGHRQGITVRSKEIKLRLLDKTLIESNKTL
jgi:hypothetical protein